MVRKTTSGGGCSPSNLRAIASAAGRRRCRASDPNSTTTRPTFLGKCVNKHGSMLCAGVASCAAFTSVS